MKEFVMPLKKATDQKGNKNINAIHTGFAHMKEKIPVQLKEAACVFRKPATEKYPFQKATVAEGFKGKLDVDSDLCVGCGLCSRECPAKAIEMG